MDTRLGLTWLGLCKNASFDYLSWVVAINDFDATRGLGPVTRKKPSDLKLLKSLACVFFLTFSLHFHVTPKTLWATRKSTFRPTAAADVLRGRVGDGREKRRKFCLRTFLTCDTTHSSKWLVTPLEMLWNFPHMKSQWACAMTCKSTHELGWVAGAHPCV